MCCPKTVVHRMEFAGNVLGKGEKKGIIIIKFKR